MTDKKLLIKDKYLNELIEEAFEEADSNLIEVAEELQPSIREIFNMNSWDEFKGPNYRFFNYKDLRYKLEITEDGVCEVTNSHRILYWNIIVVADV